MKIAHLIANYNYLCHNVPKEVRQMHLSKSKYCAFWQCPKMAWLNKYKPEERVIDDSVTARMEAGTEVGDRKSTRLNSSHTS